MRELESGLNTAPAQLSNERYLQATERSVQSKMPQDLPWQASSKDFESVHF